MPLDPASPSFVFVLAAGARLWQFDRLVECVEDFVPHARDQMLLRKRSEALSGKDAHPEELVADLELVQDEWASKYPAHFFGNLVVLLSGELEFIIKQYAGLLREKTGLLLAIEDIAAPSPYGKLRKYVQAATSESLPENSRLEDLYFLRNLFAHHGGETTHQTGSRKKRIEAIVRSSSNIFLVQDFVVLKPEYLYAASAEVSALVNRLSEFYPNEH